MKKSHLILILTLPILVGGCATATRSVSDAAMGAGGGALGYELSNGDPAITAASAAGGVALSEGVQYAARKQSNDAYVNGYEKGRSDAVKQQYWLYVNQQKNKPAADSNIRLYAIPLPEQTIDGVNLKPTTKYLRIEE